MKADDVTITELPSGGLRIHVDDQGSDSLVVIEVRRRYGQLSGRLGLRGNFDVIGRPMRWVSTYMEAREVPESERLTRRAAALRRVGR